MKLRSYDANSDFDTIVKLHNIFWARMPFTEAELRHNDATREKDRIHERLVLEGAGGEIAAYADLYQAPWADAPGKLIIDLYHPAPTGEDALLGQVMEHARRRYDAKAFAIGAFEGSPRIKMLERLGFTIEMHLAHSELDLTRFERARFEPWLVRAREAGITIRSEVELAEVDEDYVRKIYELELVIDQDIPGPDPVRVMPFEAFLARRRSPRYLPEANFVATDGDLYVGVSNLFGRDARPGQLSVGVTGIRRDYRRMGIATALKVATIDYAIARGMLRIDTVNEENNPMFRLNRALGFEPTPAWICYTYPPPK